MSTKTQTGFARAQALQAAAHIKEYAKAATVYANALAENPAPDWTDVGEAHYVEAKLRELYDFIRSGGR